MVKAITVRFNLADERDKELFSHIHREIEVSSISASRYIKDSLYDHFQEMFYLGLQEEYLETIRNVLKEEIQAVIFSVQEETRPCYDNKKQETMPEISDTLPDNNASNILDFMMRE